MLHLQDCAKVLIYLSNASKDQTLLVLIVILAFVYTGNWTSRAQKRSARPKNYLQQMSL